MSTTIPRAPSPLDAPTRGADSRFASVGAFLLLAGPALLFAGYALHPDLPEEAADIVREVVDVRNTFLIARLLVVVGALIMIPLVLYVRRTLTPDRGRAVMTVGAGLVTIGMASNAVSQATYGYLLWWLTEPDISEAAGIQVAEVATAESFATLPVSFLSVPLFALGLLLVAAGLWRARSAPIWVPVVLAVATVAGGAIGVGWPMLVVGAPITAAFAMALQSARGAGPATVAS
jgi:hypothetical protein